MIVFLGNLDPPVNLPSVNILFSSTPVANVGWSDFLGTIEHRSRDLLAGTGQ